MQLMPALFNLFSISEASIMFSHVTKFLVIIQLIHEPKCEFKYIFFFKRGYFLAIMNYNLYTKRSDPVRSNMLFFKGFENRRL